MENMNNVGCILTVDDLKKTPPKDIITKLNCFIEEIGYKKNRGKNNNFKQEEAWKIEIEFLRNNLINPAFNDVYILLEYMLPEENTERPDVILLFKDCVFSLEFKTSGYIVSDKYVTQFIDYGTRLREYHQVCISKELNVESYLIMCDCDSKSIQWDATVKDKLDSTDANNVIASDSFVSVTTTMLKHQPMNKQEVDEWVKSPRARSKKIWEQAKVLYKALTTPDPEGNRRIYSRIKSIPYSDLIQTQNTINDIIDNKDVSKKIVFVSGVPGSGKTLIGLITLFECLGEEKKARYYTGNGALRCVLHNELKNEDISEFTAFKNCHIKSKTVCNEDILIFDEAQRFWNEENNKTRFDLEISDVAGVLSADFKSNITIICLIGDNQRPSPGEAGIEAWINELKQIESSKTISWKVYSSNKYEDKLNSLNNKIISDSLYLDVSNRQHFVDLSGWVEAVLSCNLNSAKEEMLRIKTQIGKNKLGISITRSLSDLYINNGQILNNIKKLCEKNSNEKYLFGILCSTKCDFDKARKLTNGYVNKNNSYTDYRNAHRWYTGGCCNTKKIKVATETFCQGLEIDLPIVYFGGDLLLKKDENGYHNEFHPNKSFEGKFKSNLTDEMHRIIIDTYRILLTRATEEMIIVIPDSPEFDDTFSFFKEIGIEDFKEALNNNQFYEVSK